MQRKSLTDVSVPMALMLSAMLAVNINAEAGTRTYEDAARIAANYVELPSMRNMPSTRAPAMRTTSQRLSLKTSAMIQRYIPTSASYPPTNGAR